MSSPRTANLPRKGLSTILKSPHLGRRPHSTGQGSSIASLNGDRERVAELPQHSPRIESGIVEATFHFPGPKALWARLRGKSRRRIPGVMESLKAIAFCSWLNSFLIFVPIAWVAHFEILHWNHGTLFTFALCFLSTIPLEKLFDFGGEQMALYFGKDLGDLIVVTLNNAVEATLAIMLLTKCELKLLQSTITGVVLLHLLFVPGVAFLTGGARIWYQKLQPRSTQLNQTLLTIGVLALLVPTAFFSALNPGTATNLVGLPTGTNSSLAQAEGNVFLTDTLRGNFLAISRGISVILLVVYVSSRFFLYDPPGDGDFLGVDTDIPDEVYRKEEELAEEDPKVNPWVCLVLLIVTVAIMAITTSFLVDSVGAVREQSQITSEWFGVFLLPLVSFSGDGTVASLHVAKTVLFLRPEAPESLAKGRAIDMSIQFTLFWMPFLVLLGWWTDKPLTLLFDLYEVAVLVGACFLVNNVTADSKTNWAEGLILCAFYLIVALASWFYEGQIEIAEMLQCGTVADAVKTVINGGTLGV